MFATLAAQPGVKVVHDRTVVPVVRPVRELLFTAGAVKLPLPEIIVQEPVPEDGRLPVKIVLGVLIHTD